MIFVTVGTHEQSFDRLLKCIDKMIEEKEITEEVIVQKGYSNYEMKFCKEYKLIGYDEMENYIKKARIVITHGGPASFIAPISIGKIPIVFPRKKDFGEHVNDHQVEFSKQVESRMKNIIVAENESELREAIIMYNDKIKEINGMINSNNKNFVENLKFEIKKIF